MKKNTKILVSITIALVVTLSLFVPIYLVLRPKDQLMTHEAIIIWSDEDFRNFAFPGDGSLSNPYLIQNYNITTNNRYSIFIRKTYKYFIIQNCFLNAQDYSIYIDDVADGSAIIRNNICEGSEIGIYITNSDNITVTDNTCKNNLGPTGCGIIITDSAFCDITSNYCTRYEFYGIRIENTPSCYLFNNTCIDNAGITLGVGIYLFQSDNNRLVNNTCKMNKWNGIQIDVSSHIELINNTCIENERLGIYLKSCPYNSIVNNTCLRNRDLSELHSHGIRLLNSPFNNLTGNIIGSNIGNGIYLEYSSDCLIYNNYIYNHSGYSDITIFGHAIYCYESSDIQVYNNEGFNNYGSCWIENSNRMNISSNLWVLSENYTIEVFDSINCSFQYNILNLNKNGIHVTDSSSNLFSYNLIQNCEFYGMSIYGSSTNNVIHHNSFIENNLGGSSQGYDESVGNLWYDNISKEGNFWSNYLGTGNYSIDGPANSEDLYCLTENPLDVLLSLDVNSYGFLSKVTEFLAKSAIYTRHCNLMLVYVLMIILISYQNRRRLL